MSTYKGFITLHDQVCQSSLNQSQILTWITTYNDLSVPHDVTNMHHGTHYSKVTTFYSSCYNEPLKHLVTSDNHVVLFSADSFTFTVQILHCSWWPFVTLTSDDLRWPFTSMKNNRVLVLTKLWIHIPRMAYNPSRSLCLDQDVTGTYILQYSTHAITIVYSTSICLWHANRNTKPFSAY